MFIALVIFSSCSNDDDNPTTTPTVVTKAQVKANYLNLVLASYQASLTEAQAMQTAITTFTTTPTEANMTAAKNAWLNARETYGQTEAYRDSGFPIDTEPSANTPWGLGTEGLINAWPIEEGYIDYVAANTVDVGGGNFENTIIGNTSISITAAVLESLNEANDNAAAISTGWHAIEFLLWGQDNSAPSDNQPGMRPYTDYTTLANADRRKQYLNVVTTLLIDHLQQLVTTYSSGGDYRSVYEALSDDQALQQAINGAFFIAGDELSSERMIAPVNSTGGLNGTGQEDEHSCFADNTDRDIVANAQGVKNVVMGTFGTVSGASFYDLVKQQDPTQAQKLKDAVDLSMQKVNAISSNSQPFDYLITQETSSDNPQGPVMQAVSALQDLANEISASATIIGINL